MIISILIVIISGPEEIGTAQNITENLEIFSYCAGTLPHLLIFLILWDNALCVMSFIISFRIRNLPYNFHETKAIFIALLGSIIACIIYIPIYFSGAYANFIRCGSVRTFPGNY